MVGLILCIPIIAAGATNISFSCGATRVPVILEKLTKQTGMALNCSAALEDEVLFISVKDETANDLLSQIGRVTHAEWTKSGGELWLRRTQQETNEDERVETDLNLDLIKQQLAPLLATGRERAWTPEVAKAKMDRLLSVSKSMHEPGVTAKTFESSFNEMRKLAIAHRALARILARADLKSFAEMRPGERKIYTLHPSRFQYALPAAAGEALDDYATEERYEEGLLNSVPREEQRDLSENLGRNSIVYRPMAGSLDVMFTAAMDAPGRLSLSAVFVDRDGCQIDSASERVELAKPADLSELKGVNDWGGGKADPLPTAETVLDPVHGIRVDKTKVSHPLDEDPLSLVLDSSLFNLVKASGHDVIAALPDECLADWRSGKLSEFCEAIGKHVSFQLENGRLMVMPIHRGQAYSLRARRKPLEDLVRLCRERIPNLEDAAAYVTSQNNEAGLSPVEGAVLWWNNCSRETFDSIEPAGSDTSGYRTRLKFFGTLSRSQREKLVGSGISVNELNQDQIALIAKWIYQSSIHLFRQESQQERAANAASRGRGDPIKIAILEREPTYSLPDGIPGSTIVKAKLETTPAAYVKPLEGQERVLTADEIGSMIAGQERGEMQPSSGYPIILSSTMAPAMHRRFAFQILFTPLISEAFSLSDASLTNTNFVKYDQLPDEWLKPINVTLERYRQFYKGQPAQVQKPPPPRP